jgi:hypothetical protein
MNWVCLSCSLLRCAALQFRKLNGATFGLWCTGENDVGTREGSIMRPMHSRYLRYIKRRLPAVFRSRNPSFNDLRAGCATFRSSRILCPRAAASLVSSCINVNGWA